jgi:hypothetical protein
MSFPLKQVHRIEDNNAIVKNPVVLHNWNTSKKHLLLWQHDDQPVVVVTAAVVDGRDNPLWWFENHNRDTTILLSGTKTIRG